LSNVSTERSKKRSSLLSLPQLWPAFSASPRATAAPVVAAAAQYRPGEWLRDMGVLVFSGILTDYRIRLSDFSFEPITIGSTRVQTLLFRGTAMEEISRQNGWAAAFFVYRDGALALDSCTVEDSDIEIATRSECLFEQPPPFCRYSDGSPYTGTCVSGPFFADLLNAFVASAMRAQSCRNVRWRPTT
jgi:hypothetical protein